jgi:hypothetical protein
VSATPALTRFNNFGSTTYCRDLRPTPFHTQGIKNIEHHIERHYEVRAKYSDYLQRLPMKSEFFKKRLQHSLRIPTLIEAIEWRLDFHGTEDVFTEFEYRHYSTFISFFRDHTIDIPRCFRKTKSVRRRINESDILKLNNYFMRHGLRAKSWGLLGDILVELNRKYWAHNNFGSTSGLS